MDSTRPTTRIDPRVDPAAWVANNQRITHEAALEEWLALYTEDAVVNSWTGGFDGRRNQRGVELWELRGPLVCRHRMHTFLDVRPAASLRARMRAMVGGELRVKLTLLRETARADAD